MTLPPSRESHGEDTSTLSLADSHARTFRAQEKAQASMASAQVSGQKWRASLARYDPDTHSLKTAQCSLFADLIESSPTLPRWGSMRNGELFQRPTLVLRTCASASGLWQTPVSDDAINRASGKFDTENPRNGLPAAAKRYATPNASDGAKWSNQSVEERQAKGQQVRLCHQLSAGGQLNPTWVEWLQGWPSEWTDLKLLEMAKFHEWLQQHGGF
jgi:hypothetical protein